MRSDEATRADIPALIQQSRRMYETEPVEAALTLSKGIRAINRPPANHAKDQGSHLQTPNYGENVLQAAFWSLEIMGEDALAGIAPTPSEWDLNISVAESIMRMMAASNDPT